MDILNNNNNMTSQKKQKTESNWEIETESNKFMKIKRKWKWKSKEKRVHKESRDLFVLITIRLPTLVLNEQVYNTSNKYFLLYSSKNNSSSECWVCEGDVVRSSERGKWVKDPFPRKSMMRLTLPFWVRSLVSTIAVSNTVKKASWFSG